MSYEIVSFVDELTNEEWLDLRSMGIGGSDTAAIFNESAFTSAYSLWAEKSGRVERTFTGNQATEWGHLLEEIVAQKFATDYEAAVVKWPVMLRSKAHPFMLANLDFLIVQADENFPAGEITEWRGRHLPPNAVLSVLEIKTTGIVGRGGGAYWQDDAVPRGYELQGLHYSAVTGIESVVFAALVAGEGLVVRGRVYSDEERYNCVQREADFWKHVKEGIAPDSDGMPSTLETISKMYPTHKEGVTVEADDFLIDTYTQYVKTKAELKEVEGRANELRAKLEIAIGEGEAMTYNGETLFTFKATKDSEAFDAKAFEKEHPDLYSAYLKTRKGYRVMRLKEGK